MKPAIWAAGAALAAAVERWRRRETDTIEVKRARLTLPMWPRALDGLCALVVSDLHIRPDATERGRRECRLAALLSEIECDLLLVPGDCANTRRAARVAAGLLRHARPRLGAFLSLGNGEHKRPEETTAIVRELESVGCVLINRAARVPMAGPDIWLIGVDDPSMDRDRLDRAARGVPENAPRILLAHSPEIVTRLYRTPVDVVVCGHTHGGQVCPPNGRALWTQTAALERASHERSSLAHGTFGPEDFARYTPWPLERTRMYVSRGVGTAKLPIRAFCRPEVALLSLHAPGGGESGAKNPG